MEAVEMFDRIMKGEDVRREIWDRNARMSIGIAKAIAADKHEAKSCRKQHCAHGNEEAVQAHIDHAARLVEEMETM